MEEGRGKKHGGSGRSSEKKRDDRGEEEEGNKRWKIENKNNAKHQGVNFVNRGEQHGASGSNVGNQNQTRFHQNSNQNHHNHNNNNPGRDSNIGRRGRHDNNNNYQHHNNNNNRNNRDNHNNQMARFPPPRSEHQHHHHRPETMVVSEDILAFWKHIGVRVKNSGASGNGKNGGGRVQSIIDANNQNDVSMWMRIWGAAAMGAGNDDDQIVLIKAFLVNPDARNLTPPCDAVINVLHRVVTCIHRECGQQQARAPRRADRIVYCSSALENVVDIVRDRLTSKIDRVTQPTGASGTVESLVDPFHESVMALLMATNGRDERLPLLLTRQKDIKNYADALKKEAHERTARNVEAGGTTEDAMTGRRRDVRWNDWTHPTVGWLMSDSWHKTDELRSKYRDSEEYANTLARLWTVLTFYWGSGAVWQECR